MALDQELVGRSYGGIRRRLRVSRLVHRRLQDRVGLLRHGRRHSLGAIGGHIGGRHLRVGVGEPFRHRGRDGAARVSDPLFVGFAALGGFRCRAGIFAMGVAFLEVTRTLPGGLAGHGTLRLRDRSAIRIRAGSYRWQWSCQTYQKSCR